MVKGLAYRWPNFEHRHNIFESPDWVMIKTHLKLYNYYTCWSTKVILIQVQPKNLWCPDPFIPLLMSILVWLRWWFVQQCSTLTWRRTAWAIHLRQRIHYPARYRLLKLTHHGCWQGWYMRSPEHQSPPTNTAWELTEPCSYHHYVGRCLRSVW